MSQDVFSLVCAMNRESVEMQLIVQCAPVMAGLKISNLLIIREEHQGALLELLDGSDLTAYYLTRVNGKLVYLVFCMEAMKEFLESASVQRFFKREGYENLSIEHILTKFKKRYENHMTSGGEFPHEMGLILGYPIEDVEGFVKYNGDNYLYSGYWKVYNRPEEKKLIFHSFDKATEYFVRMMHTGASMKDIICHRRVKRAYC